MTYYVLKIEDLFYYYAVGSSGFIAVEVTGLPIKDGAEVHIKKVWFPDIRTDGLNFSTKDEFEMHYGAVSHYLFLLTNL